MSAAKPNVTWRHIALGFAALTPTYESNCAVGFLDRSNSIEAIDVHRQYAEVDTGIDPLRFRLRAGCSECEEQG